MPLRQASQLCETRFHKRAFQSIHAPYLMAVLRIADYLQIQAERAPREQLLVRTLRSPTSQGEWYAHDAVRNISSAEDDPESLYVDAAPAEVSTYLRLVDLLQGLQLEMDTAWAVIGEIYGRYFPNLRLQLRRVRSNLDDTTSFAKTVPYIPTRARFESAGGDLLKLLVHPLYEDKPRAGVRELIQNAVDACLEREDLLQHLRPREQPIVAALEADVVLDWTKNERATGC
jgi:molecular chaperone HtpG